MSWLVYGSAALAVIAAFVWIKVTRANGLRDNRYRGTTARQLANSSPPSTKRKGKMITCSASRIIVDVTGTDSDLIVTPNDSALACLAKLSYSADIIIIMVCDSDAVETAVRNCLRQHKTFSSQLDIKKLLFCSSVEGKAHMTRHIEPFMHIDNDRVSIQMLQPHLRRVVCIACDSDNEFQFDLTKSNNVIVVNSLLEERVLSL